MASSTLSSASQLCSSKSSMFSPSRAILAKPTRTQMLTKDQKGKKIKCQATSIPADIVPDMGKRQLMNLLLLGAVSLPTGFMLVPYAAFFAPPGEIQPTLLWKKTEHLHPMESMQFAHMLVVLYHGIQLRISSSVPATDPSTMTKEELLEDLLHCFRKHGTACPAFECVYIIEIDQQILRNSVLERIAKLISQIDGELTFKYVYPLQQK